MAAAAISFTAMKERTTDKLGNFIIILSKAVQEFCLFLLL
jgi:hypothetical protein